MATAAHVILDTQKQLASQGAMDVRFWINGIGKDNVGTVVKVRNSFIRTAVEAVIELNQDDDLAIFENATIWQ